MLKLSTIALSLLMISSVNAQVCKPDSIISSHLEGQYLDNKDGTITDIVNGLVWEKCTLGQTVVNGECEGQPTAFSTWSDALKASSENSLLQGKEYRLPNIKELGSLVERSCFDPAINLSVFPSTPSAVYWSNTPDNKINVNIKANGRVIDFRDGTEFLTIVSENRFLRLVRDISDEVTVEK